jgi:predicted amidophosphoribosyltransferase
MELVEREQNLSVVVNCPYCSKPYEVQNADGDREDHPNLCKRCAAPMDYKESHKFEEAQATEQARGGGFAQTAAKQQQK